MSTEEAPEQPEIKDSDLIYLTIKRFEAIAAKMANFEYDKELDQMMESATKLFDWVAWNMVNRNMSGMHEAESESEQ